MKLEFTRMKMTIKDIIALTFLLISLNSAGLAQDINLNKIQSSFDKFHSEEFNEKVFLHTDREFYLAGELMWFKAYNTEATTNKASSLSKVTYVEIIDDTKKPVLQTKVA